MSIGPLAKAQIISLEGPTIRVECLFNPKEYQVQRSNNWGGADNSTKNANDLTFSGSSGAKLSMQLFFDTYMKPGQNGASGATDVRDYTDELWKLMNISPDLKDEKSTKGRPPRVLFSWGKSWMFAAVITSLQQQFTMFTSTGMPVRAMVTVEFQEAVEHRTLSPGGDSASQISQAVRNVGSRIPGDLRNVFK